MFGGIEITTMMVAKVNDANTPAEISIAYDYRAFGEQITLSEPTEKVTENFTGKERDDETELNYFGARYLDPMLGLWISVDPKRQFSSPYLYVGNGFNSVVGTDKNGNYFVYVGEKTQSTVEMYYNHLSKGQQQKFDQLQKSSNRYEIQKVDEVFPDPDFDDDAHYLGGLAWASNMKTVNGDEVGGQALFANGRYFLHEVLQHLFDIENELQKNGGSAEKTMQEYQNHKQEWENRAFENENESNMPGVDIDEY